jgi:enoyl-CoA hydratase
MTTPLVQQELKAHTLWLTLNRPERLNALSIPLLDELLTALKKSQGQPDIKVIVITGAGPKSFCAGADIDSFYNESQGSVNEHAFRERLFQLFETLMRLDKPTIARVNGFALGGGFGLALGCDLVIAADHASFGTPEIQIGLFPMMIMPVLFRNIGRKKLLEMMFTGERVNAEAAERLGMINYAVPFESLDQKVDEISHKLSTKSGKTLQLGREAFYTMSEMDMPQALAYLKGMLSQNLHTKDAREGLQAFLEKRPPVWTNA